MSTPPVTCWPNPSRPAWCDLSTRRPCTLWPPEAWSDRPTNQVVESRHARLGLHPDQARGRAAGSRGKPTGILDDRPVPGHDAGTPGHQRDVDQDRPGAGAYPDGGPSGGGIPIIDVGVLALAHRRALVAGGAGERYAVVGPYLSYRELAAVVASITGRPRFVTPLPDFLEAVVAKPVDWIAPLLHRKWPDLSHQLVAGGFLRLHVSGARADACFGLVHPPAVDSIARSL